MKISLHKTLAALLLLLPATLLAANAPPRLTVEETVTINAAPDAVWAMLKRFDNLHEWHPAIVSSEASGNDKGATRTLTLGNGATIEEKLADVNDAKMTVKYNITGMSAVGTVDDHGEAVDIPCVPVNKYVAFLTVKPVDGGTQVIWKAKFYRAYTGHHEPPAELGDEAATNAITGIFQAGLANLKSMLEK